MLLQLPRSRSGVLRRKGAQEEALSPFEAGLRRDLAAGLVLAHESALGGWRKRALDFLIVLVTAPLWLIALGALFGYARARGVKPALEGEHRIGYGGRGFACWTLRLAQPSAAIVPLHPEAEPEAANDAKPVGLSWSDLATRLPQLFNVLRGEMSLVGPRPLVGDDIDALSKAGKKFYLSARPGVLSLSDVEDEAPLSIQFKEYAISWSVGSDAALGWEVISRAR